MKKVNKNKIELLAPAGNFEKLEIAIHYGADAVYLAGKNFSLRNFSGNFTIDEIGDAIAFAHKNDVKVYVACNIYSRNSEQNDITKYLETLKQLCPDAVIISDPGIFSEARKIIPEIPVHLSTQSNTTNYRTALFWEDLGVKRINMARELPLNEIAEIHENSSLELEAFIHGAMCISYSGRCLLSSYMAQRDSNRGMCTHPCRWKYSVVEDLRPGKYMPVAEDDRGTYIFNSSDLCMIEHIPEMIESGIESLKIEGRMKGINYLATTVKTYREAIDSYFADQKNYSIKDYWIEELGKISHRDYCTGFYLNDPEQILPNYTNYKYSEHVFFGKVLKNTGPGKIRIEVRNKIFKDEQIEILSKHGPSVRDKVISITDDRGDSLPHAQPGSYVEIEVSNSYNPNDIIRKSGNKS